MADDAAGRWGTRIALAIVAAALLGGAGVVVMRRWAVVRMFDLYGRAGFQLTVHGALLDERMRAEKAILFTRDGAERPPHSIEELPIDRGVGRLVSDVAHQEMLDWKDVWEGFFGENFGRLHCHVLGVSPTADLADPATQADFPLARLTVRYGLDGRFSLSAPRATITIEDGDDAPRVAEEIRAALLKAAPETPVEVVRRAP